jgi:hypothetical protein
MSNEEDSKVKKARKSVSTTVRKSPWPMPGTPTSVGKAVGEAPPLKRARSSKVLAKKASAKTTQSTKVPAPTKVPAKKAISKTGESKTKAKRTFPQRTLEDCHKLAIALRQFNGGNSWAPSSLAGSLGQSAASSGFFYLTAASRDYGLTSGTRDASKIELSQLGRELVYPKAPGDEFKALMAAFRNIDLFAKVYDYYNGGNLPEVQYLKNTLKTEWGIDEPLQDDFYELFQKNLAYLRTKGELPAAVLGSEKAGPKGSAGSILLGESNKSGKLVAFIAMPFSEKTSAFKPGYFDEVLKHLITPAAVLANFNSRTAKKAGSEVIQSTIVNDLYTADLVIVDLTEHNPNVLFELGMRIAFNKPVCLIRARGTPAIFDIDHMLRVYDYNPSIWPSSLEIDIPALSEHIVKTWEARDERSYLTMLRDNNPEST